jgi:hypothetical protein
MSTTKVITLLAVAAAASTASGCSSLAHSIGAGKQTPDEFRVVTQAPLTLPPDYSLRPPRPGEPRPQEDASGGDARATLFGQDVAASASGGERQLVSDAGASQADPNVRDTIDFESQGIVHRNEGFVNRLLAFGSGGAPSSAAPLDAASEQQRLADEEAVRRATGGGAVTISGRRSGAFKLPGT